MRRDFVPLPAANFPQMNFTQMHKHLRLELLRRIQRGTLSVSLLGRQTGFGQAHLSNFLHSRRQLSLEAMDRILAAQHLTAADLLPSVQRPEPLSGSDGVCAVPVVSHAVALFEPVIRPTVIQSLLYLPAAALESVHSRASGARRAWERFVAVRVAAADAPPMEPLVATGGNRAHRSALQFAAAIPPQSRESLRGSTGFAPDIPICGLHRQPSGVASTQPCLPRVGD